LDRLGVHRIVNAYGPATILGGSILDERINKAMQEVSSLYVDMNELLTKTGEKVAQMLGVESAFITSGAAAALTLAVAGCMTGSDGAKVEQLPDTSGLKNEVIVQTGQRNTYDRCVKVAGARLVSVGIPYLTHPWEVEAAINERTAAMVFFTLRTARPGILGFEQMSAIARTHSVPMIVDGCNEVLPTLRRVRDYFDRGAGLLVLSGGKNIQGPSDTGLVCGKKELVDACIANAYPHMHGIGRGMKVSKEQVVGLVVALEIYSQRNPEVEYSKWRNRIEYVAGELGGIPNIEVKLTPEKMQLDEIPRLHIRLDEETLGYGSYDVVRAMKAYDPPIVLDIGYWEKIISQTVIVDPMCMRESDEKVVAKALRTVLTDAERLRELCSKPTLITADAYP
jgi:L-seryl-tRNA(Ser) seleniumtransferase